MKPVVAVVRPAAADRPLPEMARAPTNRPPINSTHTPATAATYATRGATTRMPSTAAARPLATARLITVFGAGGERDRTKRPLMGAVASRLSDLVIITSDNPRGEDPNEIIEEIKRGVAMPSERTRPAESREGQPKYTPPKPTPHLAIVDRRLAIERAIGLAQPDDVVVIAGKGHEQYQVIGDREIPFDDVAVAHDALERRRAGRG